MKAWVLAVSVYITLVSAHASAQVDLCTGRGMRVRYAVGSDGALTGSYVHQAGRDDLDAYSWPASTRWRVPLGTAELVAIGGIEASSLSGDAPHATTTIYVTCADGSYEPMFDQSFRDEVTTSTPTTIASGAAWPDLIQHVTGVWPAVLTLRYDGAHYVPVASAACASISSRAMLGDVYGPQLGPGLVLAPGLRVDASAPLPEEQFRIPLALDPEITVVGTLTGDRDGTIIALAPSGDGGQCVVNVWIWSFGGNGVELTDVDAEAPAAAHTTTEVVVHTSSAAYSLLLVRMMGMFHGGCEQSESGCDDARNWIVLAIDRTRMSIAAPTSDRSFREATSRRATLRATASGAGLRAGGRSWVLDPVTRTFVAAPRR